MSENDSNVVRLPSAKERADREMVPVFELDDETYYMPAKPSAGLSLKYLKMQALEGPDAAAYYLMAEMLGDDGYDALMEHPDLEDEHIEKIMQIVEDQVLGGGASGKKTSAGAKRPSASKK